MASDAQKRALAKYKREKTHPFSMRFFPAENDLWEHFCKQENRTKYLKDLIRKDMEK